MRFEIRILQDCCTRIWDMRKPDEALHVLRGNMGAVRSLRFSNDGRFLAMAEPADFVHIFDTSTGFSRSTGSTTVGIQDQVLRCEQVEQ